MGLTIIFSENRLFLLIVNWELNHVTNGNNLLDYFHCTQSSVPFADSMCIILINNKDIFTKTCSLQRKLCAKLQ